MARIILASLFAAIGFFLWFLSSASSPGIIIDQRPAKQWIRPAYDLLQLQDRRISGFRLNQNSLQIDRWAFDEDNATRRTIELVNLNSAWTATHSRLYWTSGPSDLAQFDLNDPNSRPRIRKLAHDAPVKSLHPTANGGLLVIFEDGFSQTYDAPLERILSERMLGIELNARLIQVDGQPAIVRGSSLVFRSQLHFLPGPIRALEVLKSGPLAVAGDFDGIMLLSQGREPIKATGGVVTALASSTSHLVASGPGGVRLFPLNKPESQLPTRRLRNMVAPAGAILLAALILSLRAVRDFLARFLSDPWAWARRWFLPFWRRAKYPPPPDDLIDAIADGRVVLWTGSGISAQAYCPTRQQFTGMLLDLARREQWLPPDLLDLARKQWQSGFSEDAVDLIVRNGSFERERLVEFTFSAYSVPLLMTATCYSLGSLPWAGAISTNYDSILERLCGQSAASGTLDAADVLTRARDRKFFILKLFGDALRPGSTLLTTSELSSALDCHPVWRTQLRQISQRQPMFFVGCSPAYLLADLRLLNLDRPTSFSHFALVGLPRGDWQQTARELEESFGVVMIGIPEADLATVMPIWVEHLADRVAARFGNGPVPLAPKHANTR